MLPWVPLLAALLQGSAAARLDSLPDGTGLVGGALHHDRPLLPLKMWANPRRSQLRPRRKDLREDTLLGVLGSDYQPGWMRVARSAGGQDFPGEERAAVRALRDLVDDAPPDLRLPAGLSAEARALVKAWLVRRAACPVRFVWADLGPYFWPRWLRRGECGVEPTGNDDNEEEDNMTTARRSVNGVLREDDDDEDEDLGVGARRNASAMASTQSCSWPPGMKCVPGLTRTLHILRWHCRLRKHSQATSFNAIWSAPPEKPISKMNGRQKRSKYRCTWIKVPYSVPEDCVCSV